MEVKRGCMESRENNKPETRRGGLQRLARPAWQDTYFFLGQWNVLPSVFCTQQTHLGPFPGPLQLSCIPAELRIKGCLTSPWCLASLPYPSAPAKGIA